MQKSTLNLDHTSEQFQKTLENNCTARLILMKQ